MMRERTWRRFGIVGAAGVMAVAAGVAAAAGEAILREGADLVVRGAVVGHANRQRVVDSAVLVPDQAARPGQTVTLSVRLAVEPGWHVNSARPTHDYLIPTKIEFPGGSAASVEDVAYPEGEMVMLQFAREKLSVYEGRTTIRATLRPFRQAAPGPIEVVALLIYQACSNLTCLPPETVRFVVPIRIEGEPVAEAAARPAPGAEGAGPGGSGGGLAALLGTHRSGGEGVKALLRERGLGMLLLVVFVAGLALNLTPCVYPVMPVTIGFFMSQAASGWGKRLGLPALYVLGMAATYSVLGLVAGMTGGLFGATLQSPWVIGILCLIFVVMALSMFGLFTIQMPAFLTGLTGGRRGVAGAFLMGLTMGIAAAPCIGPFIVPLLAFVGASGQPVLGFWLFFVMALGLGLPNLILGIFSGALSGLPRSGTWLIYVKKVMGIALLAVSLYFAQRFIPERVLGVIALAFAIVAGIYLALLDQTRLPGRFPRPVKILTGLLVAAIGIWIALPMVQARPDLGWLPYSPEALDRARTERRPVIIDFFADWCVPCKELDRFTFADARVAGEAARFTLLKADLTSFESDEVRALRDRFEVIGVPTIVLLEPSGAERRDLRLFGFESPEAFLGRLRRVR